MQPRTVAVLLLMAVVFVAFFPPTGDMHPIEWGGEEKHTWQPNSAAEMRASAAAIDRRLDEGEYVFSVMGEYYSLGEHHPPYSPRIYHLVNPQQGQLEGLNQTKRHDRMRSWFIYDLETGRVALLVMTLRTDYMLERWPEARGAFKANFCRVNDTEAVFRSHDVWLYEYAPDREDCINETQFSRGR